MTTPSQKPEASPPTNKSHKSSFSQREKPPEDLLHRLRHATGRDLLTLVEDNGRHLTLRELRQVLLNSFVDGEVISAMASNRKLTTVYEARSALARHRRTPEQVAMRFIAGLFWRDLSEITLNSQLRVAVRRVAERYLVQRLSRLSQGEKIALARRSISRVAAILLSEEHARVTAAALDNPRLDEKSLIPVVASARSSPQLLDTIARHERWQFRYEIRSALCQNPRTPFRVVLRHLESLLPEDLDNMVANRDHAELIRNLAEELLERHAAPRVTIGLESLEDRSSPSRAMKPPTPRRIVERFNLDPDERGGEPVTGRTLPSYLHEKEEKAHKL